MKKNKLWGLAGALSFLLLNYPLLQIGNRDLLVAGVPLLAAYIFGVWVLAIGALYGLARRDGAGKAEDGAKE